MKTIKNIILIGLIMIITLINFTYAEKENLKDEQLFIKAFEETGADFSSLNLNISGTINEIYKDDHQLKNMRAHIIEELGVEELETNPYNEEEYMSTNTEKFKSSHIFAHGRDKNNAQLTIILYSYFDKEINSGETSIVVDLTMDKNYDEIGKIIEKVDDLYKSYKMKAEITYCIIGSFDAELNKGQMTKKITKALSLAKGKKVEGLIEDDIVSISAYSPNLDKTIYTGNKKMNLNIALSYNEYEGKTYITMGYPIITIGY
ncbi:MAG: YwmB family TATA-box binding protein [Tissierellales bacterium]